MNHGVLASKRETRVDWWAKAMDAWWIKS